MHLSSYFESQDTKLSPKGLALRRVAKSCEISPNTLYMIARGHKVPSARLACDIEHFTGGAVNRRTTLPDFPWDHPVPRLKAAS